MSPIKQVDLKKYMKVLASNSGEQYVIMVYVGFDSGLRISDILRLKFKQIDTHKPLRVKEQKTGKYKVVDISPEVKKMVANYRRTWHKKADDYIFSVRQGKPMSRTTAYRHLKSAGKQCGHEDISPHSLRKTYAINKFIESGGDLELVRKYMNHKYSSTTLTSYILGGIDISLLTKVLTSAQEQT